MVEEAGAHTALGDVTARQLANATKTVPQLPGITPRWLTHLLAWVPVEAGIYRLNRVREGTFVDVDCSGRDERVLPQTFVDYEEKPREYLLSTVNTVLDVHTRVSDLYSSPYNQIAEQLRLTILVTLFDHPLAQPILWSVLAGLASGRDCNFKSRRPSG
jgi:hypothetical protein